MEKESGRREMSEKNSQHDVSLVTHHSQQPLVYPS